MRHPTTLLNTLPQRNQSKRKHFLQSSLLSAGLLLASVSQAAGLLKPSNASYQDLQIKQHHVNVVINDMYATTSVEQVFHNPNSSDLEAVYSFPVPNKAAVGEFQYWIDGQPVIGEVVEKQQARKIYEQEKQQGRETALVEKDEYKTFDISVFPVRAGQDVRIKLVYIQNTLTDTGLGRYVYPLEEGGVDQQKVNFWTRNEAVEEAFSFNLSLHSSHPIDGIRFPNHQNAQIQQVSNKQWQVSFANTQQAANPVNQTNNTTTDENIENSSGNQILEAEQTPTTHSDSPTKPSAINPVARLDQDILLYWRHKEDLPASMDMMAYKEADKSQGTFKLTLTPADDFPKLTQGRDWIFILDISGSMQSKFASLAEGIRQGLNKLPVNDRFKIILFNDSAYEFTQGFQTVTTETVAATLHSLSQVQPDRGTNLYAGLYKATKQLESDRSSALVLVTDGVANTGITEKKAFLKLLEKHDVRLFSFIMGNSANRPLLEEMTRASEGFASSISNSDDIMGQLMLITSKLNHAAMRDIEVEVNGVRSRNLIMPRLSKTLYRGQQLQVFGHYYQSGEAEITVKAKVNGETKTYSSRVFLPDQALGNPELERLWAFAEIEKQQATLDYLGTDKDARQAIIDTAVQYGLVTDLTSMIVVRNEIFDQHNIDRNNKQRVENEQAAREKRQQAANSPNSTNPNGSTTNQNSSNAQTNNHTNTKAQPVTTAQHTSTPMPGKQASFSSSGGSGGGSITPWVVLLLLLSLALRKLPFFSGKTVVTQNKGSKFNNNPIAHRAYSNKPGLNHVH